jgi:lysophospholipase L1-like esterase
MISQKKVSNDILILNITPVDEKICATRYGAKDKVRLNKNIEEYNDLILALAKDKRIQFVEVYRPYIEACYESCLSEDGLHPNEKGHQIIFEQVKDKLNSLI